MLLGAKCLLPGIVVLGMALPALCAVALKPWTSSMALVLGPFFFSGEGLDGPS